MATKSKRKPTGPKRASPASPLAEADKPTLLRAGLKALGNVKDDVVQTQSRFFEAILGLEPGGGWGGMVGRDGRAAKLAQEALGLRKFEEVFDQRVAAALGRLGYPSAEAVREMRSEIAALRSDLAAVQPGAAPRAKKRVAPTAGQASTVPKAPPRKRRPA